jgi:hypothetical protein
VLSGEEVDAEAAAAEGGVLAEMEDLGGLEDVDEGGGLGAVDEAADDTSEVEACPGAAGVVGGLGAKEILLQEGDLGGRGPIGARIS